MPENPIYNFLKANKLTEKDEATFLREYSDSAKAKQLHGFFQANKLTDKDFNSFYDNYLKKKEPSVVSPDGGEAGTSAPPSDSGKGFGGLKPAERQPTQIFKEQRGVGEDTMLARRLAREQRAAAEGTGVRLPAAPKVVAEEKAAERALAPKLETRVAKDEQGWLANTVSALDRGFYKNLIGNPIKGLATVIQYGTEAMTGGRVKEGPVSDALNKFGDWFNNAIDEVAPQDPEFKNSLSDQFAQAFGQVGSIVFTGGLGAGGRAAGIATQAIPSAGRLAPAVAAGKELVSEITSPAAISAGLTMGQAEFDRAKKAGASDDQAFEAFYKNAAVGSILEKIPVMQFLKRFNNATAGGVANYIKTKGVAGITGGLEEATTEVLQQVYANKTAKDIYNTNQDIFEGLTESGGVGFGVGFLLNAMGANAKLLRKQGKEAEAQLVDVQIKEFESRAEKGPEVPPAPSPAVAPEMAQYTMEAPRLAGEPEQISKPIELSVEPQVPAAPETQKELIQNIVKQEEITLTPYGVDRLYDEVVKGGGKIDESQIRKILNVGYLRANRIAEDINDLGVGEVTPEAAPEVPAAEEKTYRVEYFDPESRKMTHQMFATEAEGEAFKKTLTREQTSQGVTSYFEKAPAKGVGEVALEAAPSYLQNVRQTEAEGFYKADFGRNGGLTWEIPESQKEKDSPEYLIIQSIDRNKDTGEAPKEDSKGEGAKAIADLFNKYPSVNEIVYDDYSQSGFWQKIGGDNQSLKREDFFKYYNSKFPKEAAPEVPAAPEIGSLRDVELSMRRPDKNEVIFVPIDALLQKHAKDQPSYDIQKPENRIKGRVEKAKEFIKNYIKDQRAIDPKTGERMKTKVSFEPSVLDIDENGKISFEDGRHRVLAAKELGLTEVPIEVPKEKVKAVEDLLVGEVAPEAAPKVPTAPEKTQDEVAKEQTKETDLLLGGQAEQRRKDGKYTKDGVEYIRNPKGQGIASEVTREVRFTNEVSLPFKYKLVEAETLQPSHQDGIRNPLHFIPEAQPKNRNDIGSLQAEESFANNPRFSELGENTNAYSGAPVVNERGEVVQGNNRSAGLRKGYQRNNPQYKNDLAANAEQFGFTREQVEGMKNPVLVREVAVSDQGAIELGNYDAKDLETGGKRRIDPVAVTRRMPFDVKGRIADLFTGEETLNQAIRSNQKRLLELLNPYLNQAQRNTITREGVLTDAGIKDLEAVVQQFLFDNGDTALPDLFENLSATQKEGLRKSLPYIYSAGIEKSIIPEIQEAILAANEYKESGAGDFNAWLAQGDIFNEGKTPRDKYTELELAIARTLVESKTQKEISKKFIEYADKVKDKEADMFEPAKPGQSKEQGVQETFNVKYNAKPISERGGKEVAPKEKPAAEPSAEKRPKEAKREPELPETDKRAEARKKLKDALDDFLNAGIVYDPRSQAEKQVRLTKAIINAIREEAIGAIKDLKKYLKENIGIDISDNDAKYLLIESKKPEYAIQEPTAGEVPIQPEARVGEEVEAGVPPARPPKAPKEEGETEGRKEERRFSKTLIESPELLKAVKKGVGATLEYTRQANAMSVAQAQEILDVLGEDKAYNAMKDEQTNGAVRTVLGQVLIKRYNELAKKATSKEDKDLYIDTTIDIAEYVTKKLATEAGQTIQAFSLWEALTPEAQLVAAVKEVKKSARANVNKVRKDIDSLGEKFNKANEEAIKEILKSEEVDRSVKKDAQEGVQKAKDRAAKARQKRADIIKKYKGKGGITLTTGGLTKEGIEFVGEVAVTYIEEGLAEVQVIAEKILADIKTITGSSPNDKVKQEVFEIAEKELSKSDLKIVKSVKEQRLKINEIAIKHFTEVEKIKKDLAQKFVDEADMSEDNAEALAKRFEDAFDRVVSRKKAEILAKNKKRFDRIQKAINEQAGKKAEKKTLQDEIIKYSNLGAFTADDMLDFLAKKFNIGQLTTEQAAKIEELAQKIQKAPEGSPKREATEDLLAYQASLNKGNWGEVAQGIWYANILSGYRTHEKNIISTFFNSLADLGTEVIADPKGAPYLIAGYMQGVGKKGLLEAMRTLKTGRSPIHVRAVEIPDILERKKFVGGGYNPANWFKYVGRAMKAEDVLSFQGLKEARAWQLARREAEKYGFNTWTRSGWQKVNELLLNTTERFEMAKDQAIEEGLVENSLDYKRRIYELMENSRPEAMTEDAYNFAAHGTYNYNSDGTLGAVTDAISKSVLDVKIGGVQPGRFVVPFTRIITNVVNNALDYSPVGLVRAAKGARGFKSFDEVSITKGAYKPLTPEQRRIVAIKAAVGISFASIIQYMVSAGLIDVSGEGPEDEKKKAQLREQGWQPYSIKIGDTWYSYFYTPLILTLGWMGNLNDAAKYGGEDEETLLRRASIASLKFGGMIADMTWINSAATFLGALTEPKISEQQRRVENALSGMARGFVPFAQNITQLTQAYNSTFQIPAKQVNSSWEAFYQDIPIARNSLNDKINALGEPVIKDIDIMWSKEKGSPVWSFLTNKKGWVATLNRKTVLVFDQKLRQDRPLTDDEFYELSKLRGGIIKKNVEELMQNGYVVKREGRNISVAAEDLTSSELNDILSKRIEPFATREAKKKLFGDYRKQKEEEGSSLGTLKRQKWSLVD